MSYETREKKISDFYALPLWRLVLHVGATCTILSIVITLLLVLLVVCASFRDPGAYLPLALGFGLILFLCIVVYPLGQSLRFLWQEERSLGLRYSDRADGALPEQERDWFFHSIGSRFVLLHRNYVAKLKEIRLFEETAKGHNASFYIVLFEDGEGKEHSFRLEHLASEKQCFLDWLSPANASDFCHEEFKASDS